MEHVRYEVRGPVAVITLDRPERSNAQNAVMLSELDVCFDRAVDAEAIRVIVLRATGKHFSAGHDISTDAIDHAPWLTMFDDVDNTGMLRMYDWEAKHYFGYAKKWRDLPKPTIAAVQGACIAAGLMLAWPMDLIVAADDARFSDPVLRMGIGGVEYHGHTWEFGARKAKEMLFTAGYMDAVEAMRIGMVNRVVPRAELDDAVYSLAAEIAKMHPHALRMAKRAINATLDAMGQRSALEHAFDLHSLGHANAWATWGKATTAGLQEMTEKNKEG